MNWRPKMLCLNGSCNSWWTDDKSRVASELSSTDDFAAPGGGQKMDDSGWKVEKISKVGFGGLHSLKP